MTALAGLVVAGTPGRARTRQLDLLRIEALSRIESAIDVYARDEGRLPAALDDLRSGDPMRYGSLDLRDPVTRAPYEYAVTDSVRYSLCATFAGADSLGMGGAVDTRWAHPAGRACFARTVHRLNRP